MPIIRRTITKGPMANFDPSYLISVIDQFPDSHKVEEETSREITLNEIVVYHVQNVTLCYKSIKEFKTIEVPRPAGSVYVALVGEQIAVERLERTIRKALK